MMDFTISYNTSSLVKLNTSTSPERSEIQEHYAD